MNENIPYDLITKYLAGECSNQEKTEIEAWRDLNIENRQIFNQLMQTWEKSALTEYSINIDNALGKVTDRINSRTQKKVPVFKLAMSVAAGLLLGLGIFGIATNKIGPSKRMVLVNSVDSKPVEYILPDGSIVTMNSGSTLTYPKKFSNTERRITFVGEAYFDIAKDKSKPFIIESGNTETKVLGTEFNFNARTDTLVQISVTEGLVSLSIKTEPSKEVFLESGQVGEYVSNSTSLAKYENKDLNFLAWKNGKLQFINQDLRTAISQISKYYNVVFQLENSKLDTIEFTASFDNLSLDEVKSNLELILDVSINNANGKWILIQNNKESTL